VLSDEGYDENVSGYIGFHAQDPYTDAGLYPTSLPAIEGGPVPVLGSGTSSGSAWSASASDTLDGGPWYKISS
jgi:hypothetical protein